MATQKYRCYRECYAYNKRFKKGDQFPILWLEKGYKPQPEYFIMAEDYEDKIRELSKQKAAIFSAADDPRPTAVLIAELKKVGLEVPKDWNRKRIWMALKQRENAEAKTEPRGPGRPAKDR